MSNRNHCTTHRTTHRTMLLTVTAAVLGSGLGFNTVGCYRLNEGHCALQGGDAWCRDHDLGTTCVYEIDGALGQRELHGCHPALTDELERHAHVEYGLPTAVFNEEVGAEPGADRLTTIEGQLAGLVRQGILRADCDVTLDDLQAQVEDAIALRREIDPGKGKARNPEPYLLDEQRQRIIGIVEAIDARFEPCVVDGGTETDTDGTDTDVTTGGETETDGEDTTTTGPMPCSGDGDCGDPAAPYCDPLGVCVDCSGLAEPDAACAGTDPNVPLCVGGACVACTVEDSSVCEAQALVCEVATNSCVPCTEHDQCEAGACDLLAEVPTCFEPGNVVHVGSGQALGTVAAGLMEVESMGWERAVLVLHEGVSFDETAVVSGGAIAFVAADGQSPQWVHTSMPAAPTLSVSGAGTRVYVDALRMALNGNDRGLACDGAAVDVRRSAIVSNAGSGVTADGGCELFLENSFIGDNGNGLAGTPGISVAASTATVSYSTVARNDDADTDSLLCTGGVDVRVIDSILVGRDAGSVDCPTAVIEFCATDEPIAGNTEVGAANAAWFINVTGGNFSLTPLGATVFDGIAQWDDGDPPFDIDGDPRPTTSGTPDYAGADIP